MYFTKRPLAHFLFYIIAFGLLLASHAIAPTSLAGPGLDAWVLLLIIIGMIAMFFMGLRMAESNRHRVIIAIIHAGGVALMAYLILF